MEFNLIEERWIPVRRRDGTQDRIAPHEVTKEYSDNPVVALDAPRPDFNGALIQFLIGLVQTTAAPDDDEDWEDMLIKPPSPEVLQQKFLTVRHAFNLFGDGPRFMQDYDELDNQASSIEGLLIDEPGENALKNNTDFFVKRKSGPFFMCPACCSAAIFSLQTNAPAGGRGYMTSLRGGGPLTTLVLGPSGLDTLWQNVWLNVLETTKFKNLTGNRTASDSGKFPWLAKAKSVVSQNEIHPSQYFWATPRRIKLNQEGFSDGKCDICSVQNHNLVSHYTEVPNGTKYLEPMKHPLSAFNGKSSKAVLTQPGGIVYRHWLGLVAADDVGKNEPARIVHEFVQERQRSEWQFRLWAFGYDFVPGQNKARCWYESRIPLIYAGRDLRLTYEHIVTSLIRAAIEIAKNVRSAVKQALFKRPGDVKGDTGFINDSFWHQTEPDFYATLHKVKRNLEAGEDPTEICNVWHRVLRGEALRLFDFHAWNGPVEEADPKQVVTARKKLQQFNNSKKIKQILGLQSA
jgi:CRISPR system Cascade subunit CasA